MMFCISEAPQQKLKGANLQTTIIFPYILTILQQCYIILPFVNNKNRYSNTWRSGGALLIENTQSTVIISHCSFIDNSAYYSGGAIFTGSSLLIQQSRFMSNQVSSIGNGGAIYSSGIDISISINQSEFVNNRISQNAGNGGTL